jgi:hypothetical protein
MKLKYHQLKAVVSSYFFFVAKTERTCYKSLHDITTFFVCRSVTFGGRYQHSSKPSAS